MKKIFFLFFIVSFFDASAQVYLKVANYRPTGRFGFVFKPTVSAEIGYTEDFDSDYWRRHTSIFYAGMKPRLDVFPVVTTVSGAQNAVLPGTQTYSGFHMVVGSGGADLAIYQNDKFSAFAGFDMQLGGVFINAHRSVPTFMSEETRGVEWLLGFRGRLGCEYMVKDKLWIFANAGRSVFLITENGFFGANEYALGIRYNIDF